LYRILRRADQQHPVFSRSHVAVLPAGLAAALLTVGCGVQYRPVVSAINPVGPAGQPTKYAVAVSSPTSTTQSLVTFVDVSGDTVLSTPQILTSPNYFTINNSGSEGYAVNAQGDLNYFGLSNPTADITSTIGQTTLPVSETPVSLSAFSPASGTSTLFVPEASATNPTIAALNSGSAALYSQVAVGPNPVYVVGADGAARVYAISQGATPGVSTGQVGAIEATSSTSLSVSATIPVGVKPVYGVMTSDDRRAFILNEGSGTVTVLNVINNALDAASPTITIPNIAYSGGTTAPNPVWADLSPVNSELVVLNQGDGVHPGTLSIINIPLCTNSSPATNPNCDSSNPVDATGFGQIVGTATVGVNPTMVSVLKDGTAAYVANSGNATTQGSVSVVSLVTNTVIATLPASSLSTAPSSYVYGHPATIAATTGSPTGKVYVTAPDSTYLTVIYTDTNTVQNHLSLQGNGFRVLVTAP
jgi:DNA-binding beta-propeller fold protein YncE